MKFSDDFKKVSETFQVYMYANGFMIEISGRDHDDDWKTLKMIYSKIEDVHEAIDEIIKIPKDN